jgi:DNA invertase Pin-like site-specific DNA recombinase
MTETESPPSRKLGYARVSTKKQDTQLQRDALNAAGCNRIFQDKLSGKLTDRPEFNRCLAALKPGDELIVWKLDRPFRSFEHCIAEVSRLAALDIRFKCLTQPEIDTTTAIGRAFWRMSAVFAELERDVTSERVRAGLAASKKRIGRPLVLVKSGKRADVMDLLREGQPVARVARLTGVSKRTLFRHMAELRT